MIVKLPEPHLSRWLHLKPKLDTSRLPENYLEGILIFAAQANKLESLLDGFATIVRLAHGGKGTLLTDFAPQSFTFDSGGLFGGLIFHGAHDGGGNGQTPTLSVCLNPVDGWSIHT